MRRSNSISCGLILFTLLALLLTACSSGPQVMDGEDMVRSYTQISQDEAKKMMEQDGTQIIVDVRMQEEYDSGHIPGAICIPNESIGTEPPEELPDFDQIILIYCRSGNRSKQAAQKLFDMGYINVYEFGGINDWTGEVVTKEPDTDTSQESEPEMQITEEKTDMKHRKSLLSRLLTMALAVVMLVGILGVGASAASIENAAHYVGTSSKQAVKPESPLYTLHFSCISWRNCCNHICTGDSSL